MVFHLPSLHRLSAIIPLVLTDRLCLRGRVVPTLRTSETLSLSSFQKQKSEVGPRKVYFSVDSFSKRNSRFEADSMLTRGMHFFAEFCRQLLQWKVYCSLFESTFMTRKGRKSFASPLFLRVVQVQLAEHVTDFMVHSSRIFFPEYRIKDLPVRAGSQECDSARKSRFLSD